MDLNKYNKIQKEQIINFFRAEGVRIIVPLLEGETEKQTMFIKNDVLHINLKNKRTKIINLNKEDGADLYKNLDLLPFNVLKFFVENIKFDFSKINKNIIPILPNLYITREKTGTNLTFENFASLFLLTSFDLKKEHNIYFSNDYLYEKKIITLYGGFYWDNVIKSNNLWYSSFWRNTDGWGVLEVKKWFGDKRFLIKTLNVETYYSNKEFLYNRYQKDLNDIIDIEPSFYGHEKENYHLNVITLIKVKDPKTYMLNMLEEFIKNYTGRIISLAEKRATYWLFRERNYTYSIVKNKVDRWFDNIYDYISKFPSLKNLTKKDFYNIADKHLKNVKNEL